MNYVRELRTSALGFALLGALGLLPLACGSTNTNPHAETEATHSCSAPTTDAATGLVECAEGYRHRPSAVVCQAGALATAASGDAPAPNLVPRASGEDCEADPTFCNSFAYGFCFPPVRGGPLLGTCRSGCAIDADCGPEALCMCGDPLSPTGGVCVPGSCRSDQDCGAGYLCASYYANCELRFACQTERDECGIPSDCETNACGVRYAPLQGQPPTDYRVCIGVCLE